MLKSRLIDENGGKIPMTAKESARSSLSELGGKFDKRDGAYNIDILLLPLTAPFLFSN